MQNSTLRAMRPLGAMALLGVGAIHLQQYIGADYRVIPTIGSLFLLNAVSSAIVAVALLLPIERNLASRRADGAIAGLAATGVGIAVGSLIGLFISESGGLFGFTEPGYRGAVVIAIVAEAATTVLLAPVAAVWTHRALSDRSGSRGEPIWAGQSRSSNRTTA